MPCSIFGGFYKTDVELLTMIVSTVALSIKNARFSESPSNNKEAYREITSLSSAKDKVINHASHELKRLFLFFKAAHPSQLKAKNIFKK